MNITAYKVRPPTTSYSIRAPYTPPKHSDLYATLKKRRSLRQASHRNPHTEAYATLFLCSLALAYFIIALAIH